MTITPFVRAFGAALALSAAAAACSSGGMPAAPPPGREAIGTPQAVSRPTAPFDGRVTIDDAGTRLHLSCSGSGPSTVVFVAGFGGAGDSWDAVAPPVAEQRRACTYDRPGTGSSDEPPSDQTFLTEAQDLHDLLEAAGEPGPYVVVGHSFGGAQAVSFASRYRNEVTGLVLVDASPAEWPRAVCAVPDDGSAVAGGWRDTCTSFAPDQNAERLDATAAFQAVATVSSLDDLPMVVLTRADVSNPGLPAATEAALAATWRQGQRQWASLSSSARMVEVGNTSHNIQVDQPAVVIEHVLGFRA